MVSAQARALGACTSALALSLALGWTSGAVAQEADVEEVVITGTSIRGVAAVGSPTVGVSLEEMKASGVATAGEMTRLLPQVVNLGADPGRSTFTGGAQDAAANSTTVRSVNLRGIGPEATLLLVNGRRVAPSGVIKAIADLDQIPTSALSRIEVVADGASAIYGSDAVAGVVNLITRKNFDGAETTYRYGWADNYEVRQWSQTLGKTWTGGSVFFAFEHYDNSHLSGSKRDFASQDRRARGGSDARVFTAAPGNVVVAGVRYPIPSLAAGGTPNRFDEAAYNDLMPYQRRNTVFLDVRQKIAQDRIEVWYQGGYTRRKFDLQQPPAPATLSVPATNAFFRRPAGTTGNTTVEYRLLDDDNPNSYGFENASFNAVGFTADVGRDWQLEAYVQHTMDRGFQAREGVINNAAMAAALASSNPATAFNPYDNGTFNQANNPALFDIIDAERDQYGTWLNDDFSIKADGPIFDMAGGSVRVAIGAEYHDNNFKQSLFATNVLASGATTVKQVLNDRTIKAYFGEIYVPLVGPDNAMPFIHRLELNAAVRHEKYSDFGKTTNPKFSGAWSPMEGLSVRGSWGTSFRAPSLVDSADQIQNIFISNLTDPQATAGTTTRGIFFNGGNSALGPEEAETWTAGFDWRPKGMLDGLEASVTYYNIDYSNRIDVVPNTALAQGATYAAYFLRRPPASDVAGTAAFNARAQQLMSSPDLQNPAEAIANINAIIDGRRQNLGSLKQDGLDVSLAYSLPTDFGRVRAGVDYSKIFSVRRRTAATTPEVQVNDTFGNPVDVRIRGNASWLLNEWSASVFVNYIDGYRNTAITPNVGVKSWTTVDGSVSYEVADDAPWWSRGVRVTLSATNLFDKDPPVVLNNTFSWDSQAHSALGRLVSLEVSKRW